MNPTFPGRILIIDDDPDLRDIYKETLTESGYEVDLATEGREGLSKIMGGGYDLILLDIMLPHIDGISILRKLKAEKSLPYNGPIFVLSNLSQKEVIDEALDLGARGYIVKSDITPDQFLSKISHILQSEGK